MIQGTKAVPQSRLAILLDGFRHDFVYALRSLRGDFRSSIIAVLGLALGICASTVVFSFVYNAIFQPVRYKDFQRSVVFKIQNLANAGGWKERDYFFAPEVQAFREQNHVFEEMIAYAHRRDYYNDGKSVRYLPRGAVVTANTFDYLGVRPQFGRGITPEDGKPGAAPVFVMSYRLWQTEFGGATDLLGKVIFLDDRPTTLVGIMPKHLEPLGASYWMPATVDESQPSLAGGAQLMGRLKPGVSLQAAAADLNEIAYRLEKDGVAVKFLPEKFAIIPQYFIDTLIGNFKNTLYALLGAVLLLLLIACSNVANLLLARATARELEIAMRAVMGASRGRLIRQFLMESLLLAVMASAAGCGLTFFLLKLLVAMIPAGTLPSETVVQLNAPVLLLSLGATILTALLCGLAPALHVAHSDLQPQLSGSSKGANERGRSGRLRNSLVVSQVALSILLLVGAGLFLRSFLVLTRVDLGFNPKNISFFRLDPTMYARREYSERKTLQNALTLRLLEELRALPGVESASESIEEPPFNYEWSDTIIPGRPHAERWETRFDICSEDYFRVLGVPLMKGRVFSEDDISDARLVMVVNQAFARQYFPNENPLGQQVKLEVLDRPFLHGPRDAYFEVVGVVRNYKTRRDNSWQDFPEVFIPYSVQAFSWRTFMARTSIDANLFLKLVSEKVSQIDPSVRIQASGTVEHELQDYYQGPKFELVTLSAFGSIGLLLVIIGVASVMAYSVSLRTHEIGVRMAIGAQRSSIIRLVLLGGLRLVAVGTVLGLVASFAFARFFASQISGVPTNDPWTLSAVVSAVVIATTAACVFPAQRAASVDPLVALHHQ
ncbi:MAG TPA: ABC transporter permease [Candidatus Acidoferrum sp.]|nr:ABC transporter permease [Candidatus Acidoferrum sp.]